MHLFNLPLPLALEEIGVTHRDFVHPSPAHGPGHVNRVILLAILIARGHGKAALSPAVWAAAHLHDLARRHDGPCDVHGERAVTMRLPHYLPLYRRGGLTDRDLPPLCTAVAQHCTDAVLPSEHPHYRLWALLRDADYLDRVRFGEQLNPHQLRHERARDMIEFAEKLTALTGPDATFPEVWNAMERLVTPPQESLDDHPYHWDDTETPQERRDRRLAQASHHPKNVKVAEHFWDPALSAEIALQEVALSMALNGATLREFTGEFLKAIPRGVSILREISHELRPFTATRRLEAFRECGEYRSFWEAGPSWHYLYVDNPEPVRLHHNLRLFGERDAFMAYGCLIDPREDIAERQFIELSATYGPDIIEWKPEILDDSTFCLNDSQKAGCVLPFSRETWIKARFLLEFAAATRASFPQPLMPWPEHEFHFWEWQCHRRLTSEEVSSVRQSPACAEALEALTR